MDTMLRHLDLNFAMRTKFSEVETRGFSPHNAFRHCTCVSLSRRAEFTEVRIAKSFDVPCWWIDATEGGTQYEASECRTKSNHTKTGTQLFFLKEEGGPVFVSLCASDFHPYRRVIKRNFSASASLRISTQHESRYGTHSVTIAKRNGPYAPDRYSHAVRPLGPLGMRRWPDVIEHKRLSTDVLQLLSTVDEIGSVGDLAVAPILADAVQECGIDDPHILTSLRGPTVFHRMFGYHVLRNVVAKEKRLLSLP